MMHDAFYSDLMLPCARQKMMFKQMSSSMFMQLQKYLIENNDELIDEFFNNIITSCNKHSIDAKNFNCIDKLACLMKIRSISCGDSVIFTNQQNVQASMSMSSIIDALKPCNNQLISISKDVQISIGLPSSMNLHDITKVIEQCIKSISVNGMHFKASDVTDEQMQQFMQNLNASAVAHINKFIAANAHLKVIAFQGNEHLQLDDIILSPFNDSIMEFCKFIFKDDLMNQYKNIHMLCSKSHLTPDFLLSIAPIEQQLYIKLLADEIEATNEQLKQQDKAVNMPNYG
jgi:hypothetical protein